jgi:hypothetical protein
VLEFYDLAYVPGARSPRYLGRLLRRARLTLGLLYRADFIKAIFRHPRAATPALLDASDGNSKSLVLEVVLGFHLFGNSFSVNCALYFYAPPTLRADAPVAVAFLADTVVLRCKWFSPSG